MIMGQSMRSGVMPLNAIMACLEDFQPIKKTESQPLKKCHMLQELHGQDFPTEGTVFKNLLMENTHTFSGGPMMTKWWNGRPNQIIWCSDGYGMDFQVKNYVKCLPPFTMVALDSQMADSFQKSYLYLYPSLNCIGLNWFARIAFRTSIGQDVLNSVSTSRENSTIVSAYWPVSDFPQGEVKQSIGQIQYFIKHELITNGTKRSTFLHTWNGIVKG